MQSSLKSRSFSPQAKRQSFEIEPLGPTIGAQLHGIDFSKPLDDETFNLIENALIKHKVIFAREQTISTSEQVALGYLFGELEVHPFRPMVFTRNSWCLTTTKTIPCCPQTCGTATPRFDCNRPNTQS